MRRILALAGLVLLLNGGCERCAEFPIASVAAVPAVSDDRNWQQVDSLGSREGPFKALGDHVLNAGAKGSVSYTVGGSPVEKDLDADVEILIRRFENRRGDSLVLVYKKRRPVAG